MGPRELNWDQLLEGFECWTSLIGSGELSKVSEPGVTLPSHGPSTDVRMAHSKETLEMSKNKKENQ